MMSSFRTVFAVLGCVLLACLLQIGWRKWRKAEETTELLRSLTALEELKEHTKEFLLPEVLKVTPNIYVAIGYALANTILIEGPESIAIVDVTESLEAGLEVMEAFRNITKKPVSDIVYTHYHTDHVNGAKAFIEDGTAIPKIWAHSLMKYEFENWFGGPTKSTMVRSMRQFGVFLPDSINSGIGHKLRFGKHYTSALVYPTHFVTDKETDVTLAGIAMQIIHIPGETDDQIGVWIPEQKVFLCADDMYKAFPNLYAIRGTNSRNLRKWVSSLDTMLALKPDILIPSHTRPLIGQDQIREVLTLYRDSIQYIHDQTLRAANKGMHPDDIANSIALPEHLSSFPFLRQYYGTVFWSSKAVFTSYFGWFSGDPAELYPMKRIEKSRRMLNLAGGEAKTLEAAKKALKGDDMQWALELSSHILIVNADNVEAKKIKIECLSILGSREISANGRNYFLTTAFEQVSDVKITVPTQAAESTIETFDLKFVLSMLSIRFMPEQCGDKNTTLLFRFTDTNRNIGLHMRNSIVAPLPEDHEKPDITVTTTERVLRDILSQNRMAVTAIATGDLQVDGGIIAFKSFFDCYEL